MRVLSVIGSIIVILHAAFFGESKVIWVISYLMDLTFWCYLYIRAHTGESDLLAHQ